jgi:hypothetical protein
MDVQQCLFRSEARAVDQLPILLNEHLVLLLLLLLQVRAHGLDVVRPGRPRFQDTPQAAAALRSSSSEADAERVAAHMLAQEGVSHQSGD